MLRILLIEEDTPVRRAVQNGLADEFEIVHTADTAEALRIALQSGLDAILLDLNLPGFSGLELCRTLSSVSHTKSTPIFVMVDKVSDATRQSCVDLGAWEVFSRPPDLAQLKAALRSLDLKHKSKSLDEVQVQLKVVLKLIGKTDSGRGFELLTATDQVSINGFQCRCTVPVKDDSVVEVYHILAEGERRVGQAKLVSTEWPGMPWQACRFQFIEKSSPWIV